MPRFTTSTITRPLAARDRPARGSRRPRALDAPGRVARGERQVGDGTIRRVRGIDGQVDAASQLFVRTDVGEGTSIGEGASQRELETRDGHDGSSSAGHATIRQ